MSEKNQIQETPEASVDPRYVASYRDGYYIVTDTTTGQVVPPDPGHYKKYRDGYLWDYAAVYAADDLNRGVPVQQC